MRRTTVLKSLSEYRCRKTVLNPEIIETKKSGCRFYISPGSHSFYETICHLHHTYSQHSGQTIKARRHHSAYHFRTNLIFPFPVLIFRSHIMKIISAGSASVFFRIAGHFSILVGKLLYRYKNPVFYSLFPIKDPLRRQFLPVWTENRIRRNTCLPDNASPSFSPSLKEATDVKSK